MSQLLTADYVQRTKPGTASAVAAATRISRQQQKRPSISTRSSSEFVSSNSELESVDSETSSLVGHHSQHNDGDEDGDGLVDAAAKDGESDALKRAKEALEARK